MGEALRASPRRLAELPKRPGVVRKVAALADEVWTRREFDDMDARALIAYIEALEKALA